MKIAPSTVFTVILLLIAILFVFTAKDFPLRPRLYPLTVGSMMIILCVILLVRDIRRIAAGKSLERGTGLPADLQTDYGMPAKEVGKRFVFNIALIVILYVGIWLVGFRLSITVFFLTYLTFRAKTKWFVTIILTVSAVLFLVYLDLIIHAFWPEGILKNWLPWLP